MQQHTLIDKTATDSNEYNYYLIHSQLESKQN